MFWLHDAYLVSVWLHILAAATWFGGMLFVALVVVPSLRKGDRAFAIKLLGDSGRRFRTVGWTCFAILFVTGCFNLFARGVSLYDFFDREWVTSPFGRAVVIKVSLFAVVLVLSLVHDYSIGPRAVAELERDPESAVAAKLRHRASIIGRLNALLAVTILALAVILVRGWPAW